MDILYITGDSQQVPRFLTHVVSKGLWCIFFLFYIDYDYVA